MAINGFKDTECIENIVEKGEIAHFEQFHLFPQSFPKVFNVLKWVYMEERVKLHTKGNKLVAEYYENILVKYL